MPVNHSLKHFSLTKLAITLSFFIAGQSYAGNVGGVFGPTVNEGDRTFQYRGGYDIESEQFVQRLHYQQSINDDVRLRGVVQARRTEDSDVDYDFFQGELLWQLDDNSSTWNRAVRFDFRLNDGDRPDLVAATWTNQITWTDKWKSTALILGSIDVGSNSRSGVFLQTRADIVRKIDATWSVGAELFSSYGSTSDFADFDEQVHQVGPTLKGKLGNGWSFFSGVLVGLTDSSQDENLRLWITKSL